MDWKKGFLKGTEILLELFLKYVKKSPAFLETLQVAISLHKKVNSSRKILHTFS